MVNSSLQNSRSRLANVFYHWQWLALLLAGPFLAYPVPESTPALLLIPGLWLIATLMGDTPVPPSPLNLTLLVLSTMVLVSTRVTYDLMISLPKVAGMVFGLGVFYAFVRYGKSNRGFGLCLMIFLLTGLVIGLISLLGTEWTVKFAFLEKYTFQFAPRITGISRNENGMNPNHIAGLMLWVIPTFVALLLLCSAERRGKISLLKRRLVPASLLLLEMTFFLTFILLLTQSRGAYLAAAVCGVVLMPLILPMKWRRVFLGGVSIAILGVAVLAWQVGTDAVLNTVIVEDRPINDPVSIVYGVHGRQEIWSRALTGIQRFPLTGIGMDTFRFEINSFTERTIAEDPQKLAYPVRDISHAHNEFLQAALDLGIPGVIAFVALYLGVFWMLIQVWRWSGHENELLKRAGDDTFLIEPLTARLLALGFGGGLFAHMVYGLTDADPLGAKTGVLFWMLLGLSVSLYQHKAIAPSVVKGTEETVSMLA